MRLSRMIVTSLAAAAAATVLSSAAQADAVKLKAATFVPTRVIFAKFFKDWADNVNKTCEGKVEISIIGPSAIKSLEQWNALKSGVIDMHYGPANYYKGTLPEAGVTDLAINELTEQRENGAWEMLNKVHNEKMNARYVTQIAAGSKFYIYTTKKVENGRFEGLRLRSVPIYDHFFKSLGAQPVRMAAPDVYTSLERNVVDGAGWPLWGVVDFSWDKFLKFRYGPGFYSAGVNILTNLDKWNAMSDEQRECLHERTLWLEKVWPDWRAAQNEKEREAQEKSGVEYVDLGENFPKQAHETYWAELREANPEFVNEIRPLLTK